MAMCKLETARKRSAALSHMRTHKYSHSCTQTQRFPTADAGSSCSTCINTLMMRSNLRRLHKVTTDSWMQLSLFSCDREFVSYIYSWSSSGVIDDSGRLFGAQAGLPFCLIKKLSSIYYENSVLILRKWSEPGNFKKTEKKKLIKSSSARMKRSHVSAGVSGLREKL